MRQIAKWTILCALCAALGFGATVVVANSDQIVTTLAAMLPAPSEAAPVEMAPPAEIAQANEQMAAELAQVEQASLEQTIPLDQNSMTGGTLANGLQPIQSEQAQVIPGALSAVGTISVVRDRQIVLEASGRVDDINVDVGEKVAAGDVLIALDTTFLEWAVEQAEIGFETARINFEEAGDEITESDIAVAEANLLSAQENLAEVAAGPAETTLAAAESSAAAAWSRYEELQQQPTPNQLIAAQAQLKRAEIAVQAAQREFDKIAWLPEAAASAAASALQIATIDFEAAQAAFAEASKPATPAELQSALASAQNAQAALDELRKQPTPAQLASAEAQVASAEATLQDLLEEPETGSIRVAELGVRNAMIALEEARLALENAEVIAPIDGTVLSLNVDLGQRASAGSVVAVLANTADVELTVNVEQRDIARIGIDQPVEIAVYALPNDTFFGVVEQIAPTADSTSSFVTFPVIIRFTDGPLEKVLPGMTASAVFLDEDGEPLSLSPIQSSSQLSSAPTASPTAMAPPTVSPAETPTPAEESGDEGADDEDADTASTATPESEPEPSATPSN